MNNKCAIHETVDGPRVPMLYGSSPTEVCVKCGMWRRTLHVKGPWQPAETLDDEANDKSSSFE